MFKFYEGEYVKAFLLLMDLLKRHYMYSAFYEVLKGGFLYYGYFLSCYLVAIDLSAYIVIAEHSSFLIEAVNSISSLTITTLKLVYTNISNFFSNGYFNFSCGDSSLNSDSNLKEEGVKAPEEAPKEPFKECPKEGEGEKTNYEPVYFIGLVLVLILSGWFSS